MQKLAAQNFPGEEAGWREELLGAMEQIEKQTQRQRVDELQTKQRDIPLDERNKAELRALLTNRFSAR